MYENSQNHPLSGWFYLTFQNLAASDFLQPLCFLLSLMVKQSQYGQQMHIHAVKAKFGFATTLLQKKVGQIACKARSYRFSGKLGLLADLCHRCIGVLVVNGQLIETDRERLLLSDS